MGIIEVEGSSHIGKKRKINEDSFLMLNLAPEEEIGIEPFYLLAVADGMGGHIGGEFASQTAIKILKETFLKEAKSLAHFGFSRDKVFELMQQSFHQANNAIYQASDKKYFHVTMGSTLVATFIADREALVANVGDSRAYLLKNGKLHQITKDHSLVELHAHKQKGEKQRLKNSALKNIITRAIGASPHLKVDTFTESLEENQFLMLCSDGLHGELSDKEIEEVFHHEENVGRIVKKLIKKANQKGGSDNITVIIAALPREKKQQKLEGQASLRHQPVDIKKRKKGVKIAIKLPKIFYKKRE